MFMHLFQNEYRYFSQSSSIDEARRAERGAANGPDLGVAPSTC